MPRQPGLRFSSTMIGNFSSEMSPALSNLLLMIEHGELSIYPTTGVSKTFPTKLPEKWLVHFPKKALERQQRPTQSAAQDGIAKHSRLMPQKNTVSTSSILTAYIWIVMFGSMVNC